MIKIKAYANCDHAYVAWMADKPIADCLGFALYRRPSGQKEKPVETFVGPENGPKVPPGTSRPSTIWPIQKFMWADYLAHPGDTLQYQVVPLCGPDFDHLTPLAKGASPWSNSVGLETVKDALIQPFFNRGVVSTQWVARQLEASKGKSLKSLVDPALGATSKIRDFLGGKLKENLLNLLSAQEKAGGHIYASLFELSDPEVIPALLKFGQHAHIILSDGTHKAPTPKNGQAKPPKQPKGKPFDENSYARGLLRKGHVELHDRMVTNEHFCHHKFIVFTDPRNTAKAISVWTGSTNLTYGGVCTQANNGFLIRDATVADRFLQQWKELVKDLNDYPASLAKFDAKPLTKSVNGSKVTAWFAPNPHVGAAPKKGAGNKYGDHPDLRFARSLIQNAQEGVLFLMLNPGYAGTLLNDILDLLKNPQKDAKLYIHGVANQDPTGGKARSPLIFVHHNQKQTSSAERDILLPAAINSYAGLSKKDKAAAVALDRWVKLVDGYWKQEPTGLGVVRVHSKVILVDPLGKHPVIMAGSHNLGPKASAVNDDNLVIIENDHESAKQYAVNIITIYNQYRWRFQQVQAAKNHQTLNQWPGLRAPWKAQSSYFSGDKAKELNFWM
jgi:phosphatidylserine/phosphatidylglycerophosphate/cardiolipin synthase-like enzyme